MDSFTALSPLICGVSVTEPDVGSGGQHLCVTTITVICPVRQGDILNAFTAGLQRQPRHRSSVGIVRSNGQCGRRFLSAATVSGLTDNRESFWLNVGA